MKYVVLLSSLLATTTHAFEVTGDVQLQGQYFFEDSPLSDEQVNSAASGRLEIYQETEHQQWVASAFGRIDQQDSQRNHVDIAELYWLYFQDNWEMQIGIAKVFWGVTESQHLVDVINQTDRLEGVDGEDKLGQPMLRLGTTQDYGSLDAFILPYFRPQEFGSSDKRPFSPDVSSNQYESAAERQHLDWALRWKQTFDIYDVSLSYFDGTRRDPQFIYDPTKAELNAYYPQMRQFGLTAQATIDAWLWKLEAVDRHVQDDHYMASVAGFEYTLYGLLDSAQDLGLLMEYHFDDRHQAADSPFNNDLMLGARWALNDESSTEALFGVIIDQDTGSRLTSLEASSRLNEHWKIEFEARTYKIAQDDPLLINAQHDDYAQISLGYYF